MYIDNINHLCYNNSDHVVTAGDNMNAELSTRDKIIQVATVEFGSKDYKSASTNTIASTAGVSKGAIFKIFGSKSKLFYVLFVSSIKDIESSITSIYQVEYHNIIEKIVAVMLWKIKYFQDHPYETNIMLEGLNKPPEDIKAQLYSHIEILQKTSFESFFDKIPMDKINPSYSKDDVIRNITIALIGLQSYYRDKCTSLDDYDRARDDSIIYLKTLIKGMEN